MTTNIANTMGRPLILNAALGTKEGRALSAVALLQPFRDSERGLRDFHVNAKRACKVILSPNHPVRTACQLLMERSADMVIIDGIPLGELGNIPEDGNRPTAKTSESELALLGLLGSAGGQPLAYLQENHGRSVHQIAPQRGHESEQTFAGRAEQGFHSDNPGLLNAYRQEYLGLLGLVNEANVPTKFMAVDELVACLDEKVLAELCQPCVRLRMPSSFKFGYEIYGRPRPVFWLDDRGRHNISFHETSAVAVPGHEQAVDALLAAIRCAPRRDVICEPGRLVYFADSRWLHGRAAVASTGGRWIQRAYFRGDLHCLRQACPGSAHVFDSRKLLQEDRGAGHC